MFYCILANSASIRLDSERSSVPGIVPVSFCEAALRSVGLTM